MQFHSLEKKILALKSFSPILENEYMATKVANCTYQYANVS